MSTNTFDRRIAITESKDVERLLDIMQEETPIRPLSEHPYAQEERQRSEALLDGCLRRSRTLNT